VPHDEEAGQDVWKGGHLVRSGSELSWGAPLTRCDMRKVGIDDEFVSGDVVYGRLRRFQVIVRNKVAVVCR